MLNTTIGGSSETIAADSHDHDVDMIDLGSSCSDTTFEMTDFDGEDDISCFSYDTEEENESLHNARVVADRVEESLVALHHDETISIGDRDAKPLQRILRDLRSNPKSFLHLNLLHCHLVSKIGTTLGVEETEFLELVAAIRSNNTVATCSIGPGVFMPSLRGDQKCMLADAICGLPGLKRIHLEFPIVSDFLQALSHSRFHKHHQCIQQTGIYHCFQNYTIEYVELDNVPGTIGESFLGNMFMMCLSNFAAMTNLNISYTEEFSNPQEELLRVAMWGLSHSRNLDNVKFGYKATLPGELNFELEIGASRKADSLRVLKLRCCGEYLTCESYSVVAEMLQAHHQSLNGLVLEASVDDSGAMAIANTLGRSVQDIKALCLGTFDCQDRAPRQGLLDTLSQVLGMNRPKHTSSSLEYLSLVCQDLDDDGLCEIAAPIAQSSLKELVLFLDNENEAAISSRGVAALANILHVNETISDVSLICNVLDDDGVITWATALRQSKSTLKHLKLHCSKLIQITSKGLKALVDMLQENTVLETLEVGCIRGLLAVDDDEDDERPHPIPVLISLDDAFHAKIEYFLKLNKSGARNMHLNVNVSPHRFLETVVSQGQDLDTLLYILTMNPSFVDYGIGSPTTLSDASPPSQS